MLRQQTFFASARPFGRLAKGAAVCVAVAAALAACSSSDDPSGPPNLVVLMSDPPATPTEVRKEIARNPESPFNIPVISGMPASRQQFFVAEDVDVFQVVVPEPGTLTIRTPGLGTDIRAEDRDGNDLGGVPGSLIVTIDRALIDDKGGEVFVILSPSTPPPERVMYTVTVELRATITP